MSVITKVELFRADLRLSPPFTHASAGTVTHLNEVYLRLTADNGKTGWGEVRGNCEYVTGDTPDRILAILYHLAPQLLGLPAMNRNGINSMLNHKIHGNSASRALIDMALFDLAGQLLEQPGYVLLGGKQRDRLPSDITIAFCSLDETIKEANDYLNEGFRTLKLRVGMGAASDHARIQAVNQVIDKLQLRGAVQFCIDANQAWTAKEALTYLQLFSHANIDWFEQPVKASDINGLKKITRQTPITIVADESCQSPEDVLQLVTQDAVDAVHIKYIKAGTIERMQEMAAIAKAAHLPYMLGQMDEGRLATAALAQISAAANTNHFEICCFRRVRSEDDPAQGLTLENGAILVPDGPGIGITMNTDLLTPIAAFS
ncbi:MAG: dipeptide epimerase [Sporolactobacillus sp.]